MHKIAIGNAQSTFVNVVIFVASMSPNLLERILNCIQNRESAGTISNVRTNAWRRSRKQNERSVETA